METSWSLIRAAAAGDQTARCEFAERYLPIVRNYLLARWRGSTLQSEVDDAVQDVFLDCLKEDGALTRVEERRGEFRGFLYGVTQNVARRKAVEQVQHRRHEVSAESAVAGYPSDESGLASLFDREWAKAIMREAFVAQKNQADRSGGLAQRRVDLLRLRFQEGLPIREIAMRWHVDDAWLHHQCAQAKLEFERAWREVMGLVGSGGSVAESKWREFLCIFAPSNRRTGREAGESTLTVDGL